MHVVSGVEASCSVRPRLLMMLHDISTCHRLHIHVWACTAGLSVPSTCEVHVLAPNRTLCYRPLSHAAVAAAYWPSILWGGDVPDPNVVFAFLPVLCVCVCLCAKGYNDVLGSLSSLTDLCSLTWRSQR